MTRKEYVVAVTEQVVANPRSVLAGHGIQAAVLKEIAIRPDVIGKLAAFTYMTNNFKKGAKGLKKTENFKISGYKNFAEFNQKARTDVESFMSGLSDADADAFVNNDNIVTLLILPDTKTDNMEADIASGKSVALKFDTSVKKEYKVQGGVYVTIMFGNSLIRSVEESKAVSKATANVKIVERKTGSLSKVKASIVAKAKAKALRIAETGAALGAKANALGAELQQFAALGAEFGITTQNPKDVLAAMKRYTNETKKFLNSLNAAEKLVYQEVMRKMKKGDFKTANAMLKALGNETLTSIVKSGNVTSADQKVELRKKAIRAEIRKLMTFNEGKLAKLEAAVGARAKAQIRWEMKQVIAKIDALKAKLNVYKDLSVGAIKNKADLLSKTNTLIAENIAKGATVQEALNAAIAKLPTTPQLKQQVKQQVIQQIANGTPTNLAVQQAVQQIPAAQLQIQQLPSAQQLLATDDTVDVFGTDGVDDYELAGSSSMANLIAML